ncbi:CRISPR-associated endonuclease Cas2, partial [Tepidimonas sp.]|uniref:CRISPR-associated endonuclease Cas2 n=1 Tax=Tepidimonas sp. TaxID=2002775 RepID=UPI00391DE9F5
YGRILNGIDAEKKHLARLAENLPPEGSVRAMTVTEKQYASMRLLVSMPLFRKKRFRPLSCCCFEENSRTKNPHPAQAGWGFERGQIVAIRGERGSYNAGRGMPRRLEDCSYPG